MRVVAHFRCCVLDRVDCDWSVMLGSAVARRRHLRWTAVLVRVPRADRHMDVSSTDYGRRWALLISLYGFSSLRLDHVYFDPYILLEGFDLCRGYSGFGATSSRRGVRSLCILLNFGYSVLIAYASALINSSRETNGSITI